MLCNLLIIIYKRQGLYAFSHQKLAGGLACKKSLV